MKSSIVSVRRRQVMIAGLASVAAPALARERAKRADVVDSSALEEHTIVGADKLVISGRVVDPASRAVGGATVEAQGIDVQTTTDADGRFMLVASVGPTAAWRAFDIRVTHPRRPTRTAHVDSRALVHRDERGTRRATLEVALG